MAPGNLMIRAKQAALLASLGRPLVCVHRFMHAMWTHPGNLPSLLHLQEALKVADELLEREPREGRLHYLRGAALALLGQSQEAFLALSTGPFH